MATIHELESLMYQCDEELRNLSRDELLALKTKLLSERPKQELVEIVFVADAANPAVLAAAKIAAIELMLWEPGQFPPE